MSLTLPPFLLVGLLIPGESLVTLQLRTVFLVPDRSYGHKDVNHGEC